MNIQDDDETVRVPSVRGSLASFRREGLVFGRFGLRAAWGIAAFIAIWLVASALGSIFALGASGQASRIMQAQSDAQAHPHAAHSAVHVLFTAVFVIVNDGLPLAAMLGSAWLFSRGERRPFSVYGIGRRRWKDVLPGAFWGLALLSALVLLLHTLHLLVFESRALSGGLAVWFGCKWFLAFCIVGGAEEYFFRGYIQYTLMRGMWGVAERLRPANARPVAFWLSAIFLSIIFAALHATNGGESALGLAVVFLAGMTFAYALWRTGSLWWAIGFHTTWDWAQSFLFGVPDSGNVSVGRLFITHPSGNPLLSGGTVGPEGSVFVVLAFLLAIAAVHFTPRGVQPKIEQERAVPELHREANGSIS